MAFRDTLPAAEKKLYADLMAARHAASEAACKDVVNDSSWEFLDRNGAAIDADPIRNLLDEALKLWADRNAAHIFYEDAGA